MEKDFHKEIKNDDFTKLYEIYDEIGRGQFGKVFKGINKKSKKMIAIKIIEIYNNKDNKVNHFVKYLNNELNNMKICSKDNDNSVKYYEHFHYKDKFVIVMELCDNSLQKVLNERKKGFTCEQIFNIMTQLNKTFKIMYKNNIIHRDLKLDNILVKYNSNNNNNNSNINFIVKLTDYGISKQLENTNTTSIGTIQTMAPEILEGKNYYGYKCDLWSIGIIIYQLFFKEYPYKGETQVAIYKQIENLGKKILKKTKNMKLDNLINSLLIRDPEKRISYENYFNHPFFKENYVKNSSINNNNINIKRTKFKIRAKTFLNLQKELSIINNKETSNNNNNTLKTDVNQSLDKNQPKLYQKNNKRSHPKSPNIKLSSTHNIETSNNNNNPLKTDANQSLYKFQPIQDQKNNKRSHPKSSNINRASSLNKEIKNYSNNPLITDVNQTSNKILHKRNKRSSPKSSNKRQSSILKKGIKNYYNSPLKTDNEQLLSKTINQENNKRAYSNSPRIKQSIIVNNLISNNNTLQIYKKHFFFKKHLKNNRIFYLNSSNKKSSIFYDKVISSCNNSPLNIHLKKSFSIIEPKKLFPMKTNELRIREKKGSRNYLNTRRNTESDINNLKQYPPQNETSTFINIKDLIILEEKLKEIILSINENGSIYNKCLEFWNYYYNCSFYGKLEKLFKTENDMNNIKISINHILISVMICYDYSYEMIVLKNVGSNLIDIMNFNYNNLIIIYEHILSLVNIKNKSNIWIYKLNQLVQNYDNRKERSKLSPVAKIKINILSIVHNIRVLFKNYKTNRFKHLINIFKKINEKTYEEIDMFFRENILRIDKVKGQSFSSTSLKDNKYFQNVTTPYIKIKNIKSFSLILDVDETLAHFKINKGILRIRPGVIPFLKEVGKYYELIAFTEATQDYGDLIIDAIEENSIYFDYRFYRQHTIKIDNDFVKDLNRIGRPLNKMIIVDDMPQNFRLQKENGINIKAFWGEDVNDNALEELGKILVNIAKEGGDLRIGIEKYKDEIETKVTS